MHITCHVTHPLLPTSFNHLDDIWEGWHIKLLPAVSCRPLYPLGIFLEGLRNITNIFISDSVAFWIRTDTSRTEFRILACIFGGKCYTESVSLIYLHKQFKSSNYFDIYPKTMFLITFKQQYKRLILSFV